MKFLIIIILIIMLIKFIKRQPDDNLIYNNQKQVIDNSDKQILETLEILNNTKNPDIFFSRYDFLLERADNTKNKNLRDNIINDYITLIHNFIKRYNIDLDEKINFLKTDTAKINNINNYYNNLYKYQDRIPIETFNLFNIKVSEIKNNIENPINNHVPSLNNSKYSSSVNNTFNVIPIEIKNLLWFKDGPFKNLDVNDTDNLMSFTIEEPSAISFKLPIKDKEDNEDIGYFPSYSKLTPPQRFKYLNWLKDIRKPIDIGYVFIFYYGLERHLIFGDYINATKTIIILQHFFNNNSFNSYSNDAIVISAILHKDIRFLEYLDMDNLNPDLLSTLKSMYQLPIDSSDIIKISRHVGWTNNRYIKNHPELFEDTLNQILLTKFDGNFYNIDSNISLKLKPTLRLMLANYSLNQEDREIQIPNVLDDYKTKNEIYNLLKETHEQVKRTLSKNRTMSNNEKKNSNKSKVIPTQNTSKLLSNIGYENRYSINNDEIKFFNYFFKYFESKNIKTVNFKSNRLSDGTINVCYDSMQIGRIRLQKQKHSMQILTLKNNIFDVSIIDGNCDDFIDKIPLWYEYLLSL